MNKTALTLSIHIDFMKLVDAKTRTFRLEGFFNGQLKDGETLRLATRDREVILNPITRPDLEDDLEVKGYTAFDVLIKLRSRDNLKFTRVYKSGHSKRINVRPGDFTRINPLRYSYKYETEAKSLISNHGSIIKVAPHTGLRHLIYELRYWLRMAVHWRLAESLRSIKSTGTGIGNGAIGRRFFGLLKPLLIIAETLIDLPRAYYIRAAVSIMRYRYSDRPIWIVSDRGMAAGDNGEALFRYIQSNPVPNAQTEVLFVISKKSKDFARLEAEFGNRILNQDSIAYKIYFLLASKVISSHADIEVTNPFLRQKYHYQDMARYDFIFLQHGIIRHDHSGWLNRYKKDVKLFITSARSEYDSILHYDYGYGENNLALTGLARFDYLESMPKKKIIIAPTYRRELACAPTNNNGVRRYDSSFKNSNYFKVYNSLLCDKKLKRALDETGFTIEFYLHPNFQAQATDFEESRRVSVMSYPYDYAKAFRDASVLVTDYSSVSFDFAYLKKPLFYYQFDREEYFKESLSEKSDFFDDERDGFGPVVTKHDDLVCELIGMINTQLNPSVYVQRAESFFCRIDKNNCERIFNAITANIGQ